MQFFQRNSQDRHIFFFSPGSIGRAFEASRGEVGERGCAKVQIVQQAIRAARTLPTTHPRALQGE